MSTFDGLVKEFPSIRIDNFTLSLHDQPPLACFLSHVHSDHLKGLETFKSTFVYCTAQTRELLLRLEKYPHRMNFAKGILESRKQTYRRLKKHLKPIPLETPTTIELSPGNFIRVTLFDANHCLGACMFLIEGQGRAILYTGDIRSEQWWVDSLIRNPVLLPYTKGDKRLDNVYLDTTFASHEALDVEFPSKAEGLHELLEKVSKYPSDTIYYLDTWTFGYEEVWVALSAALDTRVHLDEYRWRLYNSQREEPTCYGPQTASLVGFKLGNHEHHGCLSDSAANVRIHSCERGTRCEVFQNENVVRITPIIARHKDQDIAEAGAGGGQGDLNQAHSLEIYDPAIVQQLLSLCSKTLQAQPQIRTQVVEWFAGLMQKGKDSINLDLELLRDEALSQDDDASGEVDLDNLPLDRLVPALIRLIVGRSEEKSKQNDRQITFPYSRHSSYQELRELIQAFRPKDVYPCTVDPTTYSPDVSMEQLFGDLCSETIFHADKEFQARLGVTHSDTFYEAETQPSSQIHSENSSPHQQPQDLANAFQKEAQVPLHLEHVRQRHVGATEVETPRKQVKRSTSERDTSGSGARRNRAWKAALGIDGQRWEGLLTSVSGYHNQHPETEL